MNIDMIMKTKLSKNNNIIKIKKIISQNGAILLVDKDKIIKNSYIIKKKLKNTIIAPVIKADGYGVGAKALIDILINCKYKNFFLGNINEGIILRKYYKNINLYILNCGFPFNTNLIKKYNLIPVLNNIQEIELWNKNKEKLPCVIHIDTGMNRLGINLKDIQLLKNKNLLNQLNIKFIMSHLACAENKNNSNNKQQLDLLKKSSNLIKKLTKKNIKSSICNSAGILLGKKYHLDFVRPGAAFLGLNPLEYKKNIFYEPLTLLTQIYQIRNVSKGMTVGYGASYKVKKDSKLATISIGYSYGLSRLLSNIGSVFVKNKEIKIVGRISMDLTVIDISYFKHNEIQPGEMVEIFGNNRSLENFAKKNNTISYEIICKMAKNIPKVIY